MVFVHFRSSVLFPLGLVWGFLGLILGGLGLWQATRTDELLRGAWRVDATVSEKIPASGQQYVWRVRLEVPVQGKKKVVEAQVTREEFDGFSKGSKVPVLVTADGSNAWLATGGGPGYGTALALMGLAAFAIFVAAIFMLVAWRRAVVRVAALNAMMAEPSPPPRAAAPDPENTPPGD